ncbi:MAG: hypothetical protein CMP23_17540, partial [Rickettsiales bacterium]|nr:hypothetical protein [Rickettsiales bacterium]
SLEEQPHPAEHQPKQHSLEEQPHPAEHQPKQHSLEEHQPVLLSVGQTCQLLPAQQTRNISVPLVAVSPELRF